MMRGIKRPLSGVLFIYLGAAAVAEPGDETVHVFLALTEAARGDCAGALPVLEGTKNSGASALLRASIAGLIGRAAQRIPRNVRSQESF